MTIPNISGRAQIAGVVGNPVGHSLSPLLHNSWIAAAFLDALYAPFCVPPEHFTAFINGMRGGSVQGLNITLPFKEAALEAADDISPAARAAGAANVLLFRKDGRIEARNTDGDGLLYAFDRQAPHLRLDERPVAVIGAGGAARGAISTLKAAGVRDVRVVNRTPERAQALIRAFDGVTTFELSQARSAFDDVAAIINATSAEVTGGRLGLDLADAPLDAVVMDMIYKPLNTPFLTHAKGRGLKTVDGLDMLIGQARPSFSAFFGQDPPASVDPRALLLSALEDET